MPEKPKAPADPIDTRLVRRLADILKDTGLTQIEVERGDLKIRVLGRHLIRRDIDLVHFRHHKLGIAVFLHAHQVFDRGYGVEFPA